MNTCRTCANRTLTNKRLDKGLMSWCEERNGLTRCNSPACGFYIKRKSNAFTKLPIHKEKKR